jgi:hypothetical protein
MRVPELAALTYRTRHALLFAGAVLLAATAYLVNLRAAVDFDLDEVMYTIAARNVVEHGSVSWSTEPIAVHPPLHFLLLGAWAVVTGTVRGPMLDALFTARWSASATWCWWVRSAGSTAATCGRWPGPWHWPSWTVSCCASAGPR